MPNETTKFLPPDAELQTLARTINDALRDAWTIDMLSGSRKLLRWWFSRGGECDKCADGNVNFFITEPPEGQPQYAVVFQSGAKRAIVKLRHRPTEDDIGDIIAGMEGWIGSPRAGPLYTTEVPSWD